MPAEHTTRETVKNPLINECWKIMHEPWQIRLVCGRNLFFDLGVKLPLAAKRLTEKIAVDIFNLQFSCFKLVICSSEEQQSITA